jgi:3-isopropylmalate/(R)-2-methylmalate dehydratase large subunit
MGLNMIEKVLANHSGKHDLKVGDIVTCKIDYSIVHDMFFTVGGQIDYKNIEKINNPDNIVILLDHAVPAPTERDAVGAFEARKFVEKHKVKHFFDVGRHGVIHQKLVEEGFAKPGLLLAAGDSHTCAAGAMNCAARGLGPADMVFSWCKGENWYQVFPTIRYELMGSLPELVMGKDLFLYIAGVYGDSTNKNIEFSGTGIKSLSISERQSISTMCAEINAEFVMFPFDEVLENYLNENNISDYKPIFPDDNAEYFETRTIDLSKLEPYISLPDYIPGNCIPVKDIEETHIDQVIIGSCSNGRVEDFKIAASILKGKKIANNVRLIATPSSQKVYLECMEEGYFKDIVEAGGIVTNPTCGACYGGHMGLLAKDEICLATTTRNFKGRMGSTDSKILLSSPATAAASAITGKVTDPRSLL